MSLFILSAICAVVYLRRYFQLSPEDRILEIKLVGVASVAVLFFNDPFYPLTLLMPSTAS